MVACSGVWSLDGDRARFRSVPVCCLYWFEPGQYDVKKPCGGRTAHQVRGSTDTYSIWVLYRSSLHCTYSSA